MEGNQELRIEAAAQLIESAAASLHRTSARTEAGRFIIAKDELSVMASRRSQLPLSWQPRCGWAIIAELYSALHEGRRSYVKHVCLSNPFPPTTVSRHLNLLIDEGWIIRHQSKEDRRKAFLNLSARSIETLNQWADKRMQQIAHMNAGYSFESAI